MLELSINKRAWDLLPPDLQAIIENAAKAENLLMASEMEQKNVAALAELRQRDDINIVPFPADVLNTLKKITEQTLAEEAAENPKFNRVHQAYKNFREQDEDWATISEKAYLDIP